MTNEEILDKIKSYQIPREDGCYDWSYAKNNKNYPTIYINGQVYIATRWVVAIKFGLKVSDKFDAMHSCDYPPCTNEDHLSPGTRSQNMQDAIRKGRFILINGGKIKSARIHCNHGHEYTPENTKWYRGYRRCRTCDQNNNNITNSIIKHERHKRGLRKSGPKPKGMK